MSVVSFSGSKRLQPSEDGRAGEQLLGKRARWQEEDQRHSNCGIAFARAHPAGRRSTLQALAALFPGMSDHDIASVLSEYGNDVDAAIRRLNELQLSRASGDTARGTASADGSGAATPATPVVAAEEAQVEAKVVEEISPAPQKTASEWVEAMVREMSSARDLEDARARAARLLEAFERGVLSHSASQETASSPTKLRHQASELARENALLKRAVAIQNARLHEAGAREREVAELRAALSEKERQVQGLQVQVYSLQVHLQKATADAERALQPEFRNPDVF
ncbi:hypothetical protein QBZ16_002931 [Prototheca wickerhamii]|uniref:CUE domain-containing protein n=1 Tax=Prototheca wickerhamii TaxID=3111 RepID=A0AAD9IL88_PROWI|nr:hypothetical protein QBZ16_002931 [Prototheca wickerhamii]